MALFLFYFFNFFLGKAAFHLDCTEANTGNLGLEFVHGKSGECVYFWLSVKSLQMQRSLLVWACEASSGMHLAELGLPGELQQKPAEDSRLSPTCAETLLVSM